MGVRVAAPSAVMLLMAFIAVTAASAQEPMAEPQLVKNVYPILTDGAMMEAELKALPTGVLAQAGGRKVTDKDLQAEIAKAPESDRVELARNSFLVVENLLTAHLLTDEARAWAKQKALKLPSTTRELLKLYFDSLTSSISVTDAELNDYYIENKEMVGGATLADVKDEFRRFVLLRKRQEMVDAHVAAIGKRTAIQVNKAWLAKQYASAVDNPVDSARLSGKPSLVDFGATGCLPCELMTPILDSLKEQHAGKLNVLFVHVRNEPILAARYGIQSIPCQVFYGKDGREISRHVGFFPREKIAAVLAGMGVR